eukprot:366266_1
MQHDGICASGSRFISFNAQQRDSGTVHQLWYKDMRQVVLFCEELRMAGLFWNKTYGKDEMFGQRENKTETVVAPCQAKSYKTNKKRRDRTTANNTWMNMNKYDEYDAAS